MDKWKCHLVVKGRREISAIEEEQAGNGVMMMCSEVAEGNLRLMWNEVRCNKYSVAAIPGM